MVADLPVNAALPPGVFSTGGFDLSNVTLPGPRNFDHVSRTGGGGLRCGALVPLVYFSSSDAQSVRGSAVDTSVVRIRAVASDATGPWIGGPFCSNWRTGGVFLAAISLNGLRT